MKLDPREFWSPLHAVADGGSFDTWEIWSPESGLNDPDLAAASDRCEIGVITDFDKTIAPSYAPNTKDSPPNTAPYPGMGTLLHELEFGDRGTAGDVYYVTARPRPRISPLPPYLAQHGFPAGPIHFGVSDDPEFDFDTKVAWLSKIMKEHPGQRFVLLGDTKNMDNRVFIEITKRYPEQVAAAILRIYEGRIPDELDGLHVATDTVEIASHLERIGVLTKNEAQRTIAATRRESEVSGVRPSDKMRRSSLIASKL